MFQKCLERSKQINHSNQVGKFQDGGELNTIFEENGLEGQAAPDISQIREGVKKFIKEADEAMINEQFEHFANRLVGVYKKKKDWGTSSRQNSPKNTGGQKEDGAEIVIKVDKNLKQQIMNGFESFEMNTPKSVAPTESKKEDEDLLNNSI